MTKWTITQGGSKVYEYDGDECSYNFPENTGTTNLTYVVDVTDNDGCTATTSIIVSTGSTCQNSDSSIFKVYDIGDEICYLITGDTNNAINGKAQITIKGISLNSKGEYEQVVIKPNDTKWKEISGVEVGSNGAFSQTFEYTDSFEKPSMPKGENEFTFTVTCEKLNKKEIVGTSFLKLNLCLYATSWSFNASNTQYNASLKVKITDCNGKEATRYIIPYDIKFTYVLDGRTNHGSFTYEKEYTANRISPNSTINLAIKSTDVDGPSSIFSEAHLKIVNAYGGYLFSFEGLCYDSGLN